ncbi:uncharacterized protein LOC143284543 isoform X2 [Babylonia areolata]|uniref:uncharacterized protein LOC143284543 isoform X2 n=1 Tax=Babylonia areolata TaxID=304850 RepID=UPI003FD46ACF
MNEGGIKQPHDELEGQDEKTSEEEISGGGAGGLGVGRPTVGSTGPGPGPGPGGPVASKRRHVRSQRMREYLQQQGEAAPLKQRKCSHPGCDKYFSSAPGLRYHQRTHLPDASNFRCQYCKKEFKSHNGLKYHLHKTKCQDAPVDVPSSPPPLPPPPPPDPQLSAMLTLPPTAAQRDDDQSSHHSAAGGGCGDRGGPPLAPPPPPPPPPAPAKNDETDSMCDSVPGGLESRNWPEPRHRKMESRRKKMEQAARRAEEVEQGKISISPPSVPAPVGWPSSLPLERNTTGVSGEATGPLLEFAKIATGPQSPLLQSVPTLDWEQARLQREWESAWWSRVVWQCFLQGTRVSIGAEASSPWFPVESVAASHLQHPSPVLPEDLSRPVPVCVLSQRKSSEHDNEVELTFECESGQQSRLIASCVSSHPFFVRNKGWASCDCSKTKEIYRLPTSPLETGDVCLPPSYTRQAVSAKDSEGTEVNSLEYSSAVVLSEMAQKRSQEGSGGQQQQQQQTTPVSPDDQHAPKAKRPMNAFLLWSQTKRPEYITKFPRTNNRDISSMLSKEWRRLSESEKKQLQEAAKVKADRQRQQFPDCWKRKHHH